MLKPQLSSPEADWRLIRAFVAVMRTGSLTKAAHSLGTTQPTVGRQIRELERLAGETYFLRRGNRLEPTDHAHAMFARANDVEGAVSGLARDLASPPSARGTVRLTTSATFGTFLIPRLVPELLASTPGLEIEIIATDVVQDLHRRDADIAVRFVAPAQPDLIARRVGSLTIGLYARPEYLDRHGRPQNADDLRQHVLLTSRNGAEVSVLTEHLGIAALQTRQPIRSDELLVRHGFLTAGLGIGPCHEWLAAKSPGLERVLPELELLRLPIWIVAHEDLRRSYSLRLVYDTLVKLLESRFNGSTR